MRDSAYWAEFVTRPVIITETGEYLTRGGETVKITIASDKHDYGCHGNYSTGQHESWHKSGRLYSGAISDNDIVSKA